MILYNILYGFFFQSRPGENGATGGTGSVWRKAGIYMARSTRTPTAIRKSDDVKTKIKNNRISNSRPTRD